MTKTPLDASPVRTLLVPSTVLLLGRWNWWPSKLRHRHTETQPAGPPRLVAVGSPDGAGQADGDG